jgi:DNA-directed RNA polymerase specialized sigma24 family protein
MNPSRHTSPYSAHTIAAARAYTAFRTQRQLPYYRYALLRLGDAEAARACVQEALDELALLWLQMLVSAQPAAEAWQFFCGRVNGGVRRARCLEELQQDTELLSRELKLSPAEISTVTGLDEAAVECHLLQAARRHR